MLLIENGIPTGRFKKDTDAYQTNDEWIYQRKLYGTLAVNFGGGGFE
jgi:hypothetical protein